MEILYFLRLLAGIRSLLILAWPFSLADSSTNQLAFVMRYIIETRGRTLEETAALFDGEQPALELQQLGHEAATLTLNEMQADSLRARLDVRLREEPSTEKLTGDIPDLESERRPSVVSRHIP